MNFKQYCSCRQETKLPPSSVYVSLEDGDLIKSGMFLRGFLLRVFEYFYVIRDIDETNKCTLYVEKDDGKFSPSVFYLLATEVYKDITEAIIKQTNINNLYIYEGRPASLYPREIGTSISYDIRAHWGEKSKERSDRIRSDVESLIGKKIKIYELEFEIFKSEFKVEGSDFYGELKLVKWK